VSLGLAAGPAAAAEPDAPGPAAEAAACAAWPGEPSPLPSAGDADAFRAEWARLRSDELTRIATALELIDGVEAHRFWRHALCLEPSDEEALAGAERTRPSALHRPAVRGAGGEAEAEASPASVASALALVARRVTGTAAPAPRAERARAERPARAQGSACGTRSTPCSELGRVDEGLARIEERILAARFRDALELAEPARARVRALDASAASQARRIRLEVLCATASVALGRDDDAREGFARVLALEPAFRLDPLRTPPKVQRALEAARGERARSGG
jgi:hypothetical protein